MLTEAVAEAAAQAVTLEQVMEKLNAVHGLLTAVLIILVLTAVFIAWGQRKIARNEVQLADLIRDLGRRDEKP
jgi:hypothetical protein